MRTIVFWLFLLTSNFLFAQENNEVVLPVKDSLIKADLNADEISSELNSNLVFNDGRETAYHFHSSTTPFLSLIEELKLWHFPLRGLSSSRSLTLINGLVWNWPNEERVDYKTFSLLYGLASIQSGAGLTNNPSGPDGIRGWTNFTLHPLQKRRKAEATYTFSNSDYRNSLRLNYFSGLLKGNWAATVSLISKWAKEGYRPGTYSRMLGLLCSVEHQFSENHLLEVTLLGNLNDGAYAGSITSETAGLANDFQYNPNWGFQSGVKRNPNTYQSFQPAVIINYKWQSSAFTKFNIAASLQKGYESRGELDWYQTGNPYPDYHKNLPSYFYLHQDKSKTGKIGDYLKRVWEQSPFQLNWPMFYEANRLNASSGEGPSLYVVSNDKVQYNRIRLGFTLSHQFNTHFKIAGGLQSLGDRAEHYRELVDLLGGNYFVNLNQFAYQSYSQKSGWKQFDLQNPNRKISPGDKYHFDYLSEVGKASLWFHGQYQKKKLAFRLSIRLNAVAYQRTGYYQHGIFTEDSYGPSGWQNFITSTAGANIQYTLSKRHHLSAMAYIGQQAPSFNHTFFAPKIRNAIIDGLQPEAIKAVELSWKANYPKWKVAIHLFQSEITHQTKVLHFYHDGYRGFVDYVLQNLDTRQVGLEFYVSIRPTNYLTIEGLFGWLQAYYSSRPKVSAFRENDTALIENKATVYWKNYTAVSGPQTVLGLSVKGHHRRWGFLKLTGSWQDRSFVRINPVRYTEKAVYLLSSDEASFKKIISQEELSGFLLLNILAGKTFSFKSNPFKWINKSYLSLYAGVQNLLNRKGYVINGAEQLRFDMDSRNPDFFPNKYLFGYARTFFISLKYSFH